MHLVENEGRPLEAKRRTRIQSLWEQGYRPRRIMQVLVGEALFEDSHLSAAATLEGEAKLLALVRSEFRDVERKKIAERRLDVVSGLTSGLSEIEISRDLMAKKLLPSQNPKSAYELTRKECIRVIRDMKAADAARKPGAKSMFIRHVTKIFRDSLALADQAASDGDFRGAAVLYNTALKAAEDAAIVQGVDVDGRDREAQRGFDASAEAARAIIEAHANRRALCGPQPQSAIEDGSGHECPGRQVITIGVKESN